MKGASDRPVMFAIRDDNTLVMLDAEGDEIGSTLDYALRRSISMEPIEPRLNLSGMYIADTGMFTECTTAGACSSPISETMTRWRLRTSGGGSSLAKS